MKKKNRKAIEVICKSFPNYESVKTIRENNIEKNLTAGNCHLSKVSARDVEQLLRNIDGKKSAGIDKIPSKVIKLSAKVLNQPVVIATNNSFNKRIFPDNSQAAYVSPLDKHPDDKYSMTNFRSVNILNTFSKKL